MLQMFTRMPGKRVFVLALVGGLSLGAGTTAASAQANAQASAPASQPQVAWVGAAGLAGASLNSRTSAFCVIPQHTAPQRSLVAATLSAADLQGALSCAGSSAVGGSADTRGAVGPVLAPTLDASVAVNHSLFRPLQLAKAPEQPTVSPVVAVVSPSPAPAKPYVPQSAAPKTPTAKASYSAPHSAAPSGIGPWTPVSGHPTYSLGNFAGDAYSGAYGTCTWYAWYRRQGEPLMQLGNASQWAANAPSHGLRVGSAPVVGATAVFQPGVQGAGSGGHVAHVEAILGGGWFIISEMNFYWNGGGFGKVDYRYVHTGSGVTFIY